MRYRKRRWLQLVVCAEVIGIGKTILPLTRMGHFPHARTNLLYGLAEAIDMLHEEGLITFFGGMIGMQQPREKRCRYGGLKFCVGTKRFF